MNRNGSINQFRSELQNISMNLDYLPHFKATYAGDYRFEKEKEFINSVILTDGATNNQKAMAYIYLGGYVGIKPSIRKLSEDVDVFLFSTPFSKVALIVSSKTLKSGEWSKYVTSCSFAEGTKVVLMSPRRCAWYSITLGVITGGGHVIDLSKKIDTSRDKLVLSLLNAFEIGHNTNKQVLINKKVNGINKEVAELKRRINTHNEVGCYLENMDFVDLIFDFVVNGYNPQLKYGVPTGRFDNVQPFYLNFKYLVSDLREIYSLVSPDAIEYVNRLENFLEDALNRGDMINASFAEFKNRTRGFKVPPTLTLNDFHNKFMGK